MSGRILQVVKTFDGALWAVQQVEHLLKEGWEVHILTPDASGRYAERWKKSGAIIHERPCEFPVKNIWKLSQRASELKEFILKIDPQIIHSHFVSTTLMLRYALRETPIPRIFQVPGPLHLEHGLFGSWEKIWSGPNDYWIASSQFIKRLYLEKYHVPQNKVFLSYYGTQLNDLHSAQVVNLRQKFQIPRNAFLVGNVSFIYPPKVYLGQRVGLKGHELMIDSVINLLNKHQDLYAIFIGHQWGKSQEYFESLKKRSEGSKRIIFTGYLPQSEILSAWREIDLGIHLPSSENCGGVVEPLLNGVPVIASQVGGLPEVIYQDETGFLAEKRTLKSVSETIEMALKNRKKLQSMGKKGQVLVQKMFNADRTAHEISQIYQMILEGNTESFQDFQPRDYL